MDNQAAVAIGTNTPRVIVQDGVPPFVEVLRPGEDQGRRFYLRNEMEMGAAVAVVNIIRRGWDPVAFIYMKPNGEVGVHGRSVAFASVERATAIMEVAKAKVLSEMFNIVSGRRTLLRRLADARFGFLTGFPQGK